VAASAVTAASRFALVLHLNFTHTCCSEENDRFVDFQLGEPGMTDRPRTASSCCRSILICAASDNRKYNTVIKTGNTYIAERMMDIIEFQ